MHPRISKTHSYHDPRYLGKSKTVPPNTCFGTPFATKGLIVKSPLDMKDRES